jgi:hypothetical protein
LLACIGDSIAYLENPMGSGSGVLISGGYLLTNAHVVDPYASVTVVFPGGERYTNVPVKGVDLTADIALVGPVTTKRVPARLGGGDSLEKGDDVFLIGYPGELERVDPEPTISRGILSRTREAKPFGLTYLQTDAAIEGGQSGGGLVDIHGTVVGISGLSFGNAYALALDGADVQRSIDAIVAGKGSLYRSVPDSGGVKAGAIAIADTRFDVPMLYLAGSATVHSVTIGFDAADKPGIEVLDALSGETLYLSKSAYAIQKALGWYDRVSEAEATAPSGGKELSGWSWQVDVPANVDVEVLVYSAIVGAATLHFTASAPVFVFPDDDQGEPIAVGQSLDRTLQFTELGDTFLVDLDAGQKITIYVGSPSGDMFYSVIGPGDLVADVDVVDDSNLGLLGHDAQGTYTAKTKGRYTILVEGDGVSTGYRISVTADR